MKFLLSYLAIAMFLLSGLGRADGVCPMTLDFSKRYLASDKTVRLCEKFADKVLLVVNTASYCEFTPQFKGLENLYEKYRDRGFVVLGFPSNDFLQEPSGEEKVQEFCRLTYGVKFPMFEKSKVARRHAEPLFRTLAEEAGQYPKWNFHKYLLSPDGRVVASFSSSVRPESIELITTIESLL